VKSKTNKKGHNQYKKWKC